MKNIQKNAPAEVEAAGTFDSYAPRKMTASQNALLTIKLLVVFGLLGAVLWGVDLWTSAR